MGREDLMMQEGAMGREDLMMQEDTTGHEGSRNRKDAVRPDRSGAQAGAGLPLTTAGSARFCSQRLGMIACHHCDTVWAEVREGDR